ncbi:hypothetical protein PENTCL1PPCAC_28999, partial [Pristionchus entomophagus]
SYFANSGTICNHLSNDWKITWRHQRFYKICTPMGGRSFPGTALSFINHRRNDTIIDRANNNSDFLLLRKVLGRMNGIAEGIFGNSAAFRTFFLPNDQAFLKLAHLDNVTDEVLLAHVTASNQVMFSTPSLAHGIHSSSIRIAD